MDTKIFISTNYNLTCEHFKIVVGRPYDTVTNINGCPECRCLCPEIDCDVMCGGEGLGIAGPIDSTGCMTCAGCRVKSEF